jgi:hypothetical protein
MISAASRAIHITPSSNHLQAQPEQKHWIQPPRAKQPVHSIQPMLLPSFSLASLRPPSLPNQQDININVASPPIGLGMTYAVKNSI